MSEADARKVVPAYAEGELVKVAYATNQPEAEMIAGLLLEAGVPSVTRRARGFDVPDFLAAGPRDVMVPQAGAEPARELLYQADLGPKEGTVSRPSPLKLVAAIGLGGTGAALVAWLLQGGG